MIKGFFGRLLVVDASHHTSHVEELDEKILQSTLGGKGLATRLLLDRNPVGVDPLAPENHFIIAFS